MKARTSTTPRGKKQKVLLQPAETARRPIRILIVDDAPLLVETLESFFRRQEDFDVVGTAANGHEALQRVSKLKPDLVLMDILMPVMDGPEATRRIKEYPEPPVVIMFTLEDNNSTRAAAKLAGADGFVAKGPEMLEALRAATGGASPGMKMAPWK